MDRRDFLKAVIVVGGAVAMPQVARGMTRPAGKPNILFVMANEFRRQAMGL